LLIFDEVVTGFRVAWGGAQKRLGVKPDLTCLGKVIGGGLPLAALAGRRDVMQGLAPVGGVYQAGTLSGNPIAVAAGLATLRYLASGRAYERLEHLGALLEQQVERELKIGNTPAVFNRFGSLFTVFLGVETVETFAHVLSADTAAFGHFFRALLERGIYYPPSQFEAAFLSLAHTEEDVACLGTAIGESLREAL
jgi:glutamate-1-semialdehyde 2,1-aminomutase